MTKSNFLEISKVYNFIDDVKDSYIIMSNVKYYKNPTISNQDILINKFEQYFNIEKNYRQRFKNKKNIEGYCLRILINPIFLEKENKKKLREYIDKTIELITDIKEDKIKWIMSKEVTKGRSIYLKIYFNYLFSFFDIFRTSRFNLPS